MGNFERRFKPGFFLTWRVAGIKIASAPRRVCSLREGRISSASPPVETGIPDRSPPGTVSSGNSPLTGFDRQESP
jgi:hypothetical protein